MTPSGLLPELSSTITLPPRRAQSTPGVTLRVLFAFVLCLIAGAAAADERVQWVAFTEPNEQAYSTEVPRGWHMVGSIARRAQLGPTPYLRMLSADRQIYIVLGDPSITLFTTPLRSSSTRPAWQGQVVQSYESSIPFAREYVVKTLPAVCVEVSVTGEKARPDLTQGAWASANPNAQHSGGEVTFSCRRNGAEMRGVNAATEANSRMAQQALASAQRTMHATAQQSEAFDRVINGSSPYVDSAGHCFQLDNTKTQWIGPGGRTVGTDGASPGPGWEQLKEVPPE
jgi:hypothetical protein